MDINIAPVIDPQGKLIHYVTAPNGSDGLSHLRKQLHLFQSIIENSVDSVIITEIPDGTPNADAHIVYVNPSFTRLTGYTAEEAIGQTLTLLQGSKTKTDIPNLIREVYRSHNSATFETISYRRNGTEFWVQWSVTAVINHHDQCTHLVLVQHETSEQHQIEDELRRERDFNLKIVQSSLSFFVTMSANGHIVTANPALLNALGYTLDEITQRDAFSSEFIPEDELPGVKAIGAELIRTKQPVSFETHLRTKVRGEIMVGWRAVPVATDDNELSFIFLTGADIGAKKQAEETKRQAEMVLRQNNVVLEERVKERTRELSKLLETSRIVSSAADLTPLLNVILDQLKDVLNYTAAGIFTRDKNAPTEFVSIASNGSTAHDVLTRRWDAEILQSHFVQPVLMDLRPVVIADIQAQDEAAVDFRAAYERIAGMPLYQAVQSWMTVPLVIRDRAIGVLVLQSNQFNHFDQAKANLALTFANQAAIAIENARLFEAESDRRQEAERRRFVAEGLSDIIDRLNSSRTLNETLDFILGQALQLLGGSGAVLFQLSTTQQLFRVQVGRNMPEGYIDDVTVRLGDGILSLAVNSRQPQFSSNLHALVDKSHRQATDEKRIPWATWLAENHVCLLDVPIIVKDQVYGVFALYYKEARTFSQEDLDLAMAIANQTALAIQNDQLRAKSAQAAALAERSRLARELHDSVSQALFGMSLGTRTSIELLSKDPARARDPMDYVLSLADAALAEMRALIFELRPESLETEGLHAAFKKQAARLVARQKIQVQTELRGDEQGISLETKEALYRIGMEAIQNTIKHARASHVTLGIDRPEDGSILLEVRDNGMGFDPHEAYPGHLGLKTMRERAEEQEGTLEIESVPGVGTCVRVRVPTSFKRK